MACQNSLVGHYSALDEYEYHHHYSIVNSAVKKSSVEEHEERIFDELSGAINVFANAGGGSGEARFLNELGAEQLIGRLALSVTETMLARLSPDQKVKMHKAVVTQSIFNSRLFPLVDRLGRDLEK